MKSEEYGAIRTLQVFITGAPPLAAGPPPSAASAALLAAFRSAEAPADAAAASILDVSFAPFALLEGHEYKRD